MNEDRDRAPPNPFYWTAGNSLPNILPTMGMYSISFLGAAPFGGRAKEREDGCAVEERKPPWQIVRQG
jgi:hypothetical protein